MWANVQECAVATRLSFEKAIGLQSGRPSLAARLSRDPMTKVGRSADFLLLLRALFAILAEITSLSTLAVPLLK